VWRGKRTVIAGTDGLVRGHLAVRHDAVLKAVELPAGIAELDAGLADVQRDDFTHGGSGRVFERLEGSLVALSTEQKSEWQGLAFLIYAQQRAS
jgi:hypothetical protein